MKKSTLMVIALIIAAIVAGLWWSSRQPGKYDDFARCLTEKGIVMYGAYWCPHCSQQKKMFGKSWEYISYIECSLPGGQGTTRICEDAGIDSYPTWDFGNGTRLTAVVRFEELSRRSGCTFT